MSIPINREPLPLSLLNDYFYCSRRAALKAIEGWREANELLQFIYIARDSAGEVRSMLKVKLRRARRTGGILIPSEISSFKSASIPIHHLESVCVFGAIMIAPPALNLCWDMSASLDLEETRFVRRRAGIWRPLMSRAGCATSFKFVGRSYRIRSGIPLPRVLPRQLPISAPFT